MCPKSNVITTKKRQSYSVRKFQKLLGRQKINRGTDFHQFIRARDTAFK